MGNWKCYLQGKLEFYLKGKPEDLRTNLRRRITPHVCIGYYWLLYSSQIAFVLQGELSMGGTAQGQHQGETGLS